MANSSRFSVLFMAVVILSIIEMIQVSDARAHMRHHREGEGSHCSKCAPGWGVIQHCARGHDTRCAECTPGTYSPHHGTQPCWICSRCGPGLYEASPCSTSTDTICDSCHRAPDNPDNPDFRRKCSTRAKVFLAPEDARNTGEESLLVNADPDRLNLRNTQDILQEDVEAQIRDDDIGQIE